MRIVTIFVIMLLLGCESAREVIESKPSELEHAKIVGVIDGDTIRLEDGRKVRLICVDTPEKGKPFYKEATNFTKSLVLNKTVTLEKDVSETDRYGRLLRYVYVGNISVNNELVASGMAMVYRYPPDIKHCDEYQESARIAVENELGLWKG